MQGLTRRSLLGSLGALAAGLGLAHRSSAATAGRFEIVRSDAQWRAMLQPPQYEVLRRHGTEAPFSSPLDHERRAGLYACAGCDLALFASQTKFDSGTGWPSFYAPLPDAVATTTDTSFFMVRTEVHCRRCGGHLGHLFDDGPKPTGLRYCMNGAALHFYPRAA